MKLFYRQIELTSKLSKIEIAERLRSVVFPASKNFDYKLVETMPVVYKGVVGDETFRIKRVRGVRDGGFPIITGTVNESVSNTSIKIEMKLRLLDSMYFYYQLAFFSLFLLVGLFTHCNMQILEQRIFSH